MKPLFFYILILVVFSANAQVFRTYTTDESFLDKINLTKRRELVKQYRQDGSVESEMEYHKGRLDGLSREYYPNGKVKNEIYFRNGRENGTARFYYPSGIIQKRIIYERGKVEEVTLYDSRGRQTSKKVYEG